MVYVKRPYELEYYAVNQWADTPVRMFAPVMVQALNQQNDVWRAVIPLPSSIRGDYRLDTHGFLLQHEFLQQPSRVRVMVRAQLVDLKGATILSTRAFEVVENATSEIPMGVPGSQPSDCRVARSSRLLASAMRPTFTRVQPLMEPVGFGEEFDLDRKRSTVRIRTVSHASSL